MDSIYECKICGRGFQHWSCYTSFGITRLSKKELEKYKFNSDTQILYH